jgi:tetratricopeptide (TPR) repeat protein
MMRKYVSILVLLAMAFGFVAFQCSSTELTSARLYIQQKNYPKAIEVLEQEVVKNPNSAEGFYLLGYVYGEEGEIEKMIENFDKSLKVDKSFEANISDSKKFHWQDKFNKGVGLFNRATKSTSEDTSKMFFDRSIKSFEDAILCQPDSVDTYKNLVFAYLNMGLEDEAIVPMKKIIEMSHSADSYAMLGEIYYNRGIALMNSYIDTQNVEDSTQAMEYYDTTIELLENGRKYHPEDSNMLMILSNAYVNADRLDEAMAAFEKGVESDPENKLYRYNYGVLLLGANEFDKASVQFEKAVDIDPEYTNALYNLGVTYVKWGTTMREAHLDDTDYTEYKDKFKLALDPLKTYLEFEPEDAKVWELLGKIYANLGMSEESKESFDKADMYRS